jgi:hypothetical protein
LNESSSLVLAASMCVSNWPASTTARMLANEAVSSSSLKHSTALTLGDRAMSLLPGHTVLVAFHGYQVSFHTTAGGWGFPINLVFRYLT